MAAVALERAEAFLTEDLLVSLAALRMAIGWARDGHSASDVLGLLDRELTALADRARTVHRDLQADRRRDPTSKDAGGGAAPDAVNLDRDGYDAEAVVSLDSGGLARAQDGRGLAPSWLTEVTAGGPAAPEAEMPDAADTGGGSGNAQDDLGDSIDALLAAATQRGDREAQG